MKRLSLMFFLLLLLSLSCKTTQPESTVLLVTVDGLRWQEVFNGADGGFIDEKQEDLRRDFLRDTPEARREVLMPFLWTVISRQGQIYGNRTKGSVAQVANGKKFSYPGYNELLTGFPDPRIDSNDRKPNPNVSVLEWLNGRPDFAGRVAAFGTWDRLVDILNRERSRLPIVAAEESIRDEPLTERQAAINDLKRDSPMPWKGNPFDSFFFHATLEHLKRHRPRLLYLMFGETDEWAHEGNYGQYLRAAQRNDRFVRELWAAAQQISPGQVSLILTTDHGRGDGPDWKSHGEKVDGAENVWIALMGTAVAPMGERSSVSPVTSSQVAATVAALVGEDYAAAFPNVGKPLPYGR